MREIDDGVGTVATLNNVGTAYLGLHDRARALANFNTALSKAREVGDRAGEASTLNNVGHLYGEFGDHAEALTYFNEALPILQEVGNRAREAVTRFNIAAIHRLQGRLGEAIKEMEIVVELDRQIEHPDLLSDSEFLAQLRVEEARR